MSFRYVGLAVLMLLVTYPSRAVPLLAPGLERLPQWARSYLQLIGPAALAALAATGAIVTTSGGHRSIDLGVVAVGTLICAAVVAVRKNLLLGLVLAAALVALTRAF